MPTIIREAIYALTVCSMVIGLLSIVAIGGCDEPAEQTVVTFSTPGDLAAQGSAAESLDETAMPEVFGLQPEQLTSQHAQQINQPVSGYSRGPGLAIVWGSDNASPLDVIDAMLDRLRHVQSTPSASDATSRVIWRLEQARDELTGQAINSPIDVDAGAAVLGGPASTSSRSPGGGVSSGFGAAVNNDSINKGE